jgi:hypothetical protein
LHKDAAPVVIAIPSGIHTFSVALGAAAAAEYPPVPFETLQFAVVA